MWSSRNWRKSLRNREDIIEKVWKHISNWRARKTRDTSQNITVSRLTKFEAIWLHPAILISLHKNNTETNDELRFYACHICDTNVLQIAAFIQAHYTQRYHRQLRKGSGTGRQISSRCLQGYTTNHAGTAKPRLHRERSRALMKVTGLDWTKKRSFIWQLYIPIKEKTILKIA